MNLQVWHIAIYYVPGNEMEESLELLRSWKRPELPKVNLHKSLWLSSNTASFVISLKKGHLNILAIYIAY